MLKFLAALFRSPEQILEEITGEFLNRERSRRDVVRYGRWLLNKLGQLEAIIIASREKGIDIPESWHSKVKLVESEIDRLRQAGVLPRRP